MSTQVPSLSKTGGPARPGGRSARIQATVYQTVKGLLETMPREELSFPLIAAQAGVTPSTLYRRWGDIQQLLADVAVEIIRPTAPPLDTGTLEGDLLAWAEQFLEESASPLGRTMLRDMAAAAGNEHTPCACVEILRGQLAQIGERAARRGEAMPAADTLIDALAAPIVYRVLFDLPPSLEHVQARVRGLLQAEPA
ncbi:MULTISPECIES: TetR/AcrR family transcriptional regulator [Delftia]|uniref:TetR/AcrR family transcriptional regulator n=1 Tax=Delftia TaxID=80865 RepID=UPI0004513640|nr:MULTISPECIES: TetR/AcrR family transcriptional regulator [Delftia]EZP47997.1 Transcriptional regulator, TetR family [Delftia sp. RIT313]QPR37502.1 TetR/AcrR family transcriptional regulator C-terminal ligand-binding domain-containing protein [Delftia acidovorans]WAT84412.1 TetR/AcrR family transcriptional regulator C-terminal ligand-binding domain-containing protein [Delftia acidovorans]